MHPRRRYKIKSRQYGKKVPEEKLAMTICLSLQYKEISSRDFSTPSSAIPHTDLI